MGLAAILKQLVTFYDFQGLLRAPSQRKASQSPKKQSASPHKVSAQKMADAYMETIQQSPKVDAPGDATTQALRAQMQEALS